MIKRLYLANSLFGGLYYESLRFPIAISSPSMRFCFSDKSMCGVTAASCFIVLYLQVINHRGPKAADHRRGPATFRLTKRGRRVGWPRTAQQKYSASWWERCVTDKDAQWSELLKALVTISRALPQRRPLPVRDAVAEADYLEAGKLYALHEQAIYDAINAIRMS